MELESIISLFVTLLIAGPVLSNKPVIGTLVTKDKNGKLVITSSLNIRAAESGYGDDSDDKSVME